MFNRGPARPQAIDDRLERPIVEQYAILGMVGYITQLVVEQPRIDRVDDPAHADSTLPGGEVLAVVHRKRRYPLARARKNVVSGTSSSILLYLVGRLLLKK